ncbi:uncharacterized protein LOC113294840 [Papaver somniferum]|uniref:uncharacterized protein LOC113294840 n=1 Tax=Papaver somniferum TaxID=3469 RepID=UPI000E6FF44E|nr:uncharacterized protein LOC113294840 [Papaver somniferum]
MEEDFRNVNVNLDHHVLNEVHVVQMNTPNEMLLNKKIILLDKMNDIHHEVVPEHNKENMGASIVGSSSVQVGENSSRDHFPKKGFLNNVVNSNLLPRIADLKRSARDNDSVSSSGRVWIGWDPSVIQVSLIHLSSQAIFVDVSYDSKFNFIATFVYGENYYLSIVSLWDSLKAFASFNSKPWVVLGDFNSLLYPHDRVGGAEVMPHHYADFQSCTDASHLFDFPFTGIFDHSPGVVSIFEKRKHAPPPPFRFYNYLTEEEDFMNLIRNIWRESVRGNPMYVLVTKLKRSNKGIILWKKERYRSVSAQVSQAKEVLDATQKLFQEQPLNQNLAERRSRNNILMLYNDENEKLEDDISIANECVSFFSSLFDSQTNSGDQSSQFENINIPCCVNQDDISELVKDVSREEVVNALASIGSNKAPGIDGFSNHFLKACWETMGDDFVAAIQNFFLKIQIT